MIRNAWHHLKRIKNSKCEIIDWNFIENLLEIQTSEKVKCGNRLTHNHVFFQNVKMKVKYAVQVLSRRVSKSLKFCREHLKLDSFQNSEATEEFILIMNDIFDLFNSHVKYSPSFYQFKNALSKDNKLLWENKIKHTEEYIRGLQTIDGLNIVKNSPRKVGFIGILSNILAIKQIYVNVIENGPMSYLCTYKLSQDPLEHFFAFIRVRYGSNNNPTPFQFKSTY